jgi:hypothetical protein
VEFARSCPILGEKLRAGTAEADAALARQGRYATVADNLRVKEVNIDTDDRFVICYNPEAADRDTAVRQRLLAQLTDVIDGSGTPSATKRTELRGMISTKPGLNRILRSPRKVCSASTTGRSRPCSGWTASTCCGAPTRNSRPRTSP